MRTVLISTYELGRQPFGLASPAAWLRAEGHEVTLADLACSPLPAAAVAEAGLIAFFLPMHTATRIFQQVVDRVRALNPGAHLCGYGLYAPLNDALLRRAGVGTVIGGEFEQGLCDLARRLEVTRPGERPYRQPEPLISIARQRFLVPDRSGLPPLGAYAQLRTDDATRRVGYTEASRGCKHLCRHCPVVPVYRGVFRIVQADVVLEDVRRQVAAGAEHITFGDPDFFNGPGHAMSIVEGLHRESPRLTYDVTIKVEHLLQHGDLLPVLKRTGCLFVTSAVESLDDAVLEKLAKGHTRAGFAEALAAMRAVELPLSPTFIPFTPWTTLAAYREFLRAILDLGLADQVAPVQFAIRLLLPEGSLLLELPEVRAMIEPFDARALCYRWQNADPQVDRLWASIQETVKRAERWKLSRGEIFRKIWDLAEAGEFPVDVPMVSRATIPYLTEPWYC
ncbi:MAG TPA: CUAEP/CCAEP-tail radical SAM protein [Bryobacteraceae bacterium]|nr:CUAEP/CCAEP-tail radical SAM protein [Bryobacteraceae bacterium]